MQDELLAKLDAQNGEGDKIHNETGTAGAVEDDVAKEADVIDGDQEREQETPRAVETASNSAQQGIQEAEQDRPCFILYMHENGYIECYLLEE